MAVSVVHPGAKAGVTMLHKACTARDWCESLCGDELGKSRVTAQAITSRQCTPLQLSCLTATIDPLASSYDSKAYQLW